MLNNIRLTRFVIDGIKCIPIDNESSKEMEFCYQTKVQIYDSKCGKCGFALQIVQINSRNYHFHNVDNAIAFSIKHGGCVSRTCEYPTNVLETINNEKIYPTVTEIVCNTCDFWRSDIFETHDYLEGEVDDELKWHEDINVVRELSTI